MDIPVTDRGNRPDIVPLEFWVTYEQDPNNPGQLKEVERVRWVRRGAANAETSDKVARLMKAKDLPNSHWSVLEPYYKAWKEKREVPVQGTPWEAWAGVTKEQAAILRKHHLFALEDLVNASDGVLVKTGLPGIREIQRMARAFLENRDRTAAAQRIASLEERTERQDAELASLRELLDTHTRPTAPVLPDADPDTVPARRGPGRPPKAA